MSVNPAIQSQQAKILLVEQDAAIIAAFHETLAYEYSIYDVKKHHYLKVLAQLKIDLIVLDLHFESQFNGYNILKEIRENHHDTPIVFISDDNSPETLRKVFEIGAIDYIKKPICKEELSQKTNLHIENLRIKE